jgi:hypothetical protein
VNLSGISSGVPNELQTLTVTAVSSAPNLIPNPTVNYTSPNASGTLSFTPVTYAFGTATISVTVNDGQSASNTISRSFTVTVNPVNQAPTLNTLGNLTINQNASLQTVNLSGISSGATNESDTLAISAASSNPNIIPHPTVNYTSPSAMGTLTFAPVAGASGVATITVTVNDGRSVNHTVTRSFTVTVAQFNLPPTLDPPGDLTINEGASAQTVNLSGISSGAPNEVQPLTVTAASSNPNIIPNPIVNYASPNTSGTLTFTPVQYAFGTATVTVTVNDGQIATNTITRSFTVTVNPVNQAPTLNQPGNVTINENAGIQTVSLSGISSGVPNEIQTLTVTAVSSDPSLIPNPTVNYTSPNASGTLTFTPVALAFGTATITVTVNDGQATANIISRSFTVTVNPVNQPPTLNGLSNLIIAENAGPQTAIFAGVSSGAPNEVQNLTVTATSSNPGLIPNPSVNYTSPSASGTLTFTPAANVSGAATITVTVNDGQSANNTVTRTFTITVSPFNLPPTLDLVGNLTINEGAGPQTVSLTGISSGASTEIQPLSVSAVSSDTNLIPNPTVNYTSPSANGILTFAPLAYANGTATITVTVNDGQIATNTITRSFTVTVNPVNQAPTLNQPGSVTVTKNASLQSLILSGISSGAPNESQGLSVTAISSDPTVIPNPAVNYTSPNNTAILSFAPAPMALGSATISVTVNDGQSENNTVTRSFVITISEVNQPPTILVQDSITIGGKDGMHTVNLSGISAGGSNEMQTLTITSVSSNPGLIPNPTVNYTNPDSTGTLTFAPLTNLTGTVLIVVKVDDGQPTNNITVRLLNVNVVATNDSIPVVTAARAGTYNGLFYEEEQVRQSSAGSLTVTVTTGKSYTGRLQIGSGRYSFRGVLDAQSRGSNVILRTGARALQLEFRLGKDAEVDQVFGRLGDGTWTSDLWGERATFNKAAILTPLAAKYTLVLPGQNGDSSVPAGNGYGTVTVATSGKATFVGTLADGTKISHSVSLGKRGLWPLYVPLYFGRGSLLSWISFADQPESDLQGAASWIKPGDPVSRYYPGGFAEQLDIVGSAYGGPGTGGHLLKFTSGRIMFEGGNLNPVFSNLINFGLGDQITNLSSNKLTLKFAIVNGTFSGKVTDPSNNKSMAFKGAVLQKLNAGYGFLLGPNRSSEVLIVQ